MTDFPFHDVDSAPEESKPLLAASIKNYGRLPGMHRVMAESPKAFEAYQHLHQSFVSSSLNPEELTVVWQTINVENECHYCVPGHTLIAKIMKVDESITESLRNETPLADPKLEALRAFTLRLIRQRGFVSDEHVQEFLDAGFSHQTVLDVILGLAQKTMSNYINHIAKTPLDDATSGFNWTRGENRIET